jgi:hypothetical protein
MISSKVLIQDLLDYAPRGPIFPIWVYLGSATRRQQQRNPEHPDEL